MRTREPCCTIQPLVYTQSRGDGQPLDHPVDGLVYADGVRRPPARLSRAMPPAWTSGILLASMFSRHPLGTVPAARCTTAPMRRAPPHGAMLVLGLPPMLVFLYLDLVSCAESFDNKLFFFFAIMRDKLDTRLLLRLV